MVFARPRPLLLGLVAQFVCMPLLAFVLCRLFNLPPQLARMLDDLVRLGDPPDDGLTVPDQPLRTPGQPS